MGTAIAKIEPLPLPAPRDPTPDLPAWAATIVDNLQRHLETREWENRYLAPERMPTAAQRVELENHKAQLVKLCDQTPERRDIFAKKIFGSIAKLTLAKLSRAGGAEMAEARAETYEAALDDVPFWAVDLAIRRWHRGQCGDDYDYTFAPESAHLRKIALGEVWRVRLRIRKIDQVLSALPYEDHAAERMKRRAAIKALGLAVDDDEKQPRDRDEQGFRQIGNL